MDLYSGGGSISQANSQTASSETSEPRQSRF